MSFRRPSTSERTAQQRVGLGVCSRRTLAVFGTFVFASRLLWFQGTLSSRYDFFFRYAYTDNEAFAVVENANRNDTEHMLLQTGDRPTTTDGLLSQISDNIAIDDSNERKNNSNGIDDSVDNNGEHNSDVNSSDGKNETESRGNTEGLSFNPGLYQKIWDEIDNYDEATRCKRYGFGYSGRQRSERRRVFYGSLIADDSNEVLLASAAELYNVLHTVAFIESNTTQSRTLRTVRHGWGGEGMDFLQSGIYGPDTRVHVDMYYDGPDEGAMYLTREHLQRELITERWIQNGMTTHDLGYLTDTDETFSRDFLRALQVCDVEQFKEPQTCKRAKIIASTLVFEGSPECITKDRRWYHPDVVMGYCIEGVGNSTGRLVALREYRNVRGRRKDESRKFDKGVDNVPLFNAPDIRQYGEGAFKPRLEAEDGFWRDVPAKETHRATAYHFHNFFEDGEVLRHKYRTYGHPHREAYKRPFESLHNDLKLMVKCVRNIREDFNETRFRMPGGFTTLVGPRPIYYQIEEHRVRRHESVRSFILTDEETYGSDYPKERTDELVLKVRLKQIEERARERRMNRTQTRKTP